MFVVVSASRAYGSWQCPFATHCAKEVAAAFGGTLSHHPSQPDVEPRHVQKVRDSDDEDDDLYAAAHHDVKDFRIACWYVLTLAVLIDLTMY